MATEVLRPHDWLTERIRVTPAAYSRRKSYYGNPNSSSNSYNNNFNSCSTANPRSSRRPVVRPEKLPEQRRSSFSKRSSSDDLKAVKAMEKVTILRRGESLDSKIKSSGEAVLKKEGGDLVVCGIQRLGPAPEMVPKRLGIVDLRFPVVGNSDVYAGSAFAVSPAPSSLPLPSFSKKKQGSPSPAAVIVDDSATRDLRRLLRID